MPNATEDDLTVLLDALAEGRTMRASVRDAQGILLGGRTQLEFHSP